MPDSAPETLDPTIETCRSLVSKISVKSVRTFFFTNIAYAEINSERYDRALADLARVLADDRNNLEALADRAVIYDHLGHAADALADRSRILAIKPHDAEGFLSVATTLSHLDRQREAIEAYSAAIRKRPSEKSTLVGALVGRANAQARIGEYTSAAADLDQALRINPNNPEALKIRRSLPAGRIPVIH
jgi:tetratricopeptide (TPR) repeat protein